MRRDVAGHQAAATFALAALRAQPHQTLAPVSWHRLDSQVRYVTPIIMGPTCVACHNTHPDSPKRDWKVFACAAALAAGFIAFQRRQTSVIRNINRKLERTNAMLASVSTKISRYRPVHERAGRRADSGEHAARVLP